MARAEYVFLILFVGLGIFGKAPSFAKVWGAFRAEYLDGLILRMLVTHWNESMLRISNFGKPVRIAKDKKRRDYRVSTLFVFLRLFFKFPTRLLNAFKYFLIRKSK
jgi:hypothetical protein